MALLNVKPKWLSPVPGGGGCRKPGHSWVQRAQEPLCQGHGEVLQSQNSNLLQSLLRSVPLRAPPLQPGSALKRQIVAFKELIFKACCPLELEWVSILLVSNIRKCRKCWFSWQGSRSWQSPTVLAENGPRMQQDASKADVHPHNVTLVFLFQAAATPLQTTRSLGHIQGNQKPS